MCYLIVTEIKNQKEVIKNAGCFCSLFNVTNGVAGKIIDILRRNKNEFEVL